MYDIGNQSNKEQDYLVYNYQVKLFIWISIWKRVLTHRPCFWIVMSRVNVKIQQILGSILSNTQISEDKGKKHKKTVNIINSTFIYKHYLRVTNSMQLEVHSVNHFRYKNMNVYLTVPVLPPPVVRTRFSTLAKSICLLSSTFASSTLKSSSSSSSSLLSPLAVFPSSS